MRKQSKSDNDGVEMSELVEQLVKIIGTQSRVIEALGDALTAMKVAKGQAEDEEEDENGEH